MSSSGYTREFILHRAGELASRVGLTGLSVGALARDLGRPKSTIFFHFGSLERLQRCIVTLAARELVRDVVRPALMRAEGLPRLERLFECWLGWDGRGGYPGGCLFVAAASEYDDRPGPVRERLVRLCMAWDHLVGSLVEQAVRAGHLRLNLDRAQFRHDLHGIMLAYHHATRLLREPDAERRARLAFAALVSRSR